MIFLWYGYRMMLLAGQCFPAGTPTPNQQALAFSRFTTPAAFSRQALIHIYEGLTAL
jgi:hypothetical protein